LDQVTELLHRFWVEMIERPGGPMTFRFYLQPTMALLFALRDGFKDAKAGRNTYFFSLVKGDKPERHAAMKQAVGATTRIFILGLVMDGIYQYRVLHGFRPVEAIVIAFVLAFMPYALLHGPILRLAARWYRRHPPVAK
jgi:hypothetical protein